MPPRHAYWTIILEGKPTAFRAHTEEELLPTLKQLQTRHPDTVLRWFSRGRLWNSREEERLAQEARKAKRPSRGREWRPGGAHRDPRDRFKVPRDEAAAIPRPPLSRSTRRSAERGGRPRSRSSGPPRGRRGGGKPGGGRGGGRSGGGGSSR